MTLRSMAEMAGTLGWLLVAFGSPWLIAMYSSDMGTGGVGRRVVEMEAVPAVEFVALALPKEAAAAPVASTPARPAPAVEASAAKSQRTSVSSSPPRNPTTGSSKRVRPGPSLEAVRKGETLGAKRGRRHPCTGIRSPDIQRGDGAYWQVSKGLVNHYATHLKEFDALGYAVAHETDHGLKGMRVGGIRCDNALHQAGLRNGDVVMEVNGREVTSWVKALWLYNTINKQRDIVITVLRRGQMRELTYRLI